MAQNRSLGLVDFAAQKLILYIALSCGLTACAHLPPLIGQQDALSAKEHAQLGAAYEAQGLQTEAAAQYEAAARKDPAEVEAWVALGNLSFNAGDWAGAERYYRRALKASPHHAGAGNNLAMVYLAQDKNMDQAEGLAAEALTQAGALKPYILDTLANIYLRQRRYAEARTAVKQALAAAPAGNAEFDARLRQTKEKIDQAPAN